MTQHTIKIHLFLTLRGTKLRHVRKRNKLHSGNIGIIFVFSCLAIHLLLLKLRIPMLRLHTSEHSSNGFVHKGSSWPRQALTKTHLHFRWNLLIRTRLTGASTMPKICVIGAGVIGLCSAVSLQENIPNAQVTVIADKFTQDTLSDGAAGIFRPSNSVRGPTDQSVKNWTLDSYAFYHSLASSSDGTSAGVKELSGYLLSSKYKEITSSPLLESILPDWSILTEEELKGFPGSWKYGAAFSTLVVECRRFLPWLMGRFTSKGGIIISRHIDSFGKVSQHYDVIVNCTGFAAKYLCHDSRIVPMRGQVFKVKAPWIKHFYYGDYDTYIVPGFDFVTLGGTRQYDSYNENIDRHDSAGIWERCCALVPSLKDAVIERQWVGLRPHRDTVRLELELLQCGQKKLPVIHNYGHGGYGVTLGWGCAVDVTNLVKRHMQSTQFRSNL